MNAGDVLSRVNNPCGGSNQISSRPGMLVMSKRDGVRKCKNDIPVANTNVKWVYDSSDYIRYRKESSINAGYAGTNSCKKPPLTDYSYGGSGAPLGRGRQIRINGSSSYGSNI